MLAILLTIITTFNKLFKMHSILSYLTTIIISQPLSPKSNYNIECVFTSDRFALGCTGRDTIGKIVNRKIVLDHNNYYKCIMK